jgi:hypothetical protein
MISKARARADRVKARISFSERFTIFLLHSKLNSVTKPLKTLKSALFQKLLSRFFEPNAHKAFGEMQSAASRLLRIEPNAYREMEQERQYQKPQHQYFAEERSPLPSVDELVNQEPPNWKQLAHCFFLVLKVVEGRSVFERIVIGGLKAFSNHRLFRIFVWFTKRSEF